MLVNYGFFFIRGLNFKIINEVSLTYSVHFLRSSFKFTANSAQYPLLLERRI
jgi:hypothetical protein